ncbi:LOB domain-containing protein 24-like [Solanum pennellii]|uniref:LOB domain-containing protein 24-like n=1 Tax=Solanum pennellii TaxID=28526 RepID=A0ABM1HKR9_SOLPN|nr:LOB domain-containing protein 24-like [Solanum pennellii]
MNDAGARGKCAACKYQRKRCQENCPLAPFFPSNKFEDFKNVNRLYKVRTIIEMLNSVADNEKKAKMVETLILEAKIRSENPVYGSIAIQNKLRLQIEETMKEIDLVKKTTDYFKELRKRAFCPKVFKYNFVVYLDKVHTPTNLGQDNVFQAINRFLGALTY